MFDEETANEIGAVAGEFGFEPKTLLAIAEVESGGRVFSIVGGRPEPLIRFEAHYFDRRLSDGDRKLARAEGLASPTAGEIHNPNSQAARWRLLGRAAAIDRKAAYESVSWGLGQVMGAHWAWLGFADVDALVAEARQGAAGQARLMARYIVKAGLSEALQSRDWEAFARGYNGPGYKRFSYHRKLGAAYQRLAGTATTGGAPDQAEAGLRASGILRQGSAGDAVRDMQRALSALGYPLETDAIFGPDTEQAVRALQKDHGLAVDGIAGPKTLEAIAAALPFGSPTQGFWSSLIDWLARFFRSRTANMHLSMSAPPLIRLPAPSPREKRGEGRSSNLGDPSPRPSRGVGKSEGRL